MISLYEDQKLLKANIRQSFKKGFKRVCACAPCSFGKTRTFSSIAEDVVNNGKRCFILVDSVELIEQTAKELDSFGLDYGIIQGISEKTDYTKSLQIATPQTLTRRWDRFDANPHWLPDVCIFDENHYVYKAHKELMNMLPKAYFIGFTATPSTKGLGLLYQDLVVGSTVRKLLDAGRLSPIRAFSCYTPDMTGIKINAKGDYNEKQSTDLLNTKTIRGDVVKNWLRLGDNRQTIVFAASVAHAVDLANAFADAGIISAEINGRTPKEMRKQIIDDFRDQEIKVLVSCQVIIKGFNVTTIGCMCDCQPTKSISRHIQKTGRVQRINDLYDDAIVLDFAGNIARNGFVEDYEPTKLDDGKKGENPDRKKTDEPLPKECPQCHFIKPPKVHECPNCRHAPEKQAGLVIEEGDLKELKKRLTPAQIKHIRETSPRLQQEFYSGMIQHALEKGHSKSYAFYKFRNYFGMDVPKEFHNNPMPKNIIVQKYIQYLNIRASKSGFAQRKYA